MGWDGWDEMAIKPNYEVGTKKQVLDQCNSWFGLNVPIYKP